MTLEEIERGFEIHEKQMREFRDSQAIHERQMRELRDNQVVQGEILAKASKVLLELANRINEISERQAVTQSGIESLIKFMDAFKERLGGGNGHSAA